MHCGGINACKGQTDCKTATNACKGQGYKGVTKEECETKGGKILEG